MPFCIKCQEKLSEGAESCPKCGTQVAGVSKPEKKDYSNIGGTLIVVRGILSRSNYGVVILSRNFFAKEWPQRELDGLVTKEMSGRKTILPIWHQIDKALWKDGSSNSGGCHESAE